MEGLDGARPRPWFGPTRGDVERALAARPDFIVPSLQLDRAPSTSRDVLARWTERFDSGPADPARLERMAALIDEYAPLAVPIPVDSQQPQVDAPEPFVILRHRSVGRLPRISIELAEGSFAVDLRHAGHRLVASLIVEATDEDGTVWSLRPTGAFEARPGLRARPRLMVYPSGRRTVRLVEASLPSGKGLRELRARLALPRPLQDAVVAEAETVEWDAVVSFDD